jgi:glycosyltransferase involved in cell wall biosynthesis
MRVSVDGRIFGESFPTGVTESARLQLHQLMNNTDISWSIYTQGFRKPNVKEFNINHKHNKLPNRLTNLGCSMRLITQNQMFGDFDVLWQPNPMFSPRAQSPTVITIHDLSAIIWPEFFEFHTRIWYNRLVRKLLSNFNPKIWLAAVSERTKKDIELFFPHWKGRVEYVPSVPPAFMQTNSDFNQKKTITDPYIVALSTVEPRKNMASIYQAHKKLLVKYPSLKLVIIGRYLQKIGDEINKSVIFTGYLSDNQKREFLSGAECIIYPSYYEGYGYPPLEALSTGTPAIVSCTGALPETLENGVLYVNPNRAESEICKIVSELMSNPQWKNELIQVGRSQLQHLHDKYTVKPMINLLENAHRHRR